MIRRLFLLATLALPCAGMATEPRISPAPSTTTAAESERLYLSGHDAGTPKLWQFRIDRGAGAGAWGEIPVPSNWEPRGFGQYAYGLEEEASDEAGVYRVAFRLPERWRHRRLRLVFEGAMTETTPRLNGERLTVHHGGFTEFAYDVTDEVRFGALNELEVHVAERSSNRSVNAAERAADYWVWGGIYRPVYVEATPASAIETIRHRADAGGRLRVSFETHGAAPGSALRVRLLDRSGRAVPSATGERLLETPVLARGAWLDATFPAVAAWSSETPTLYWLEATLVDPRGVPTHRRRERLGFVSVRLGGAAAPGLFVNGRRILLRGVNRHSSRPGSGHALSRQENREDVRLIRALGFNAVRTAHSPPDRDFLDACDELGLFVIDEVPGWHARYRTPVGRRVVRELMERDAGRPSVLLWANGNEGGWNRLLDVELVRLDPRRRPVLHPEAVFGGFDTVHYPSYAELARRLAPPARSRRPPPLVLPTEWLHALDHGGGAAGLEGYWKLMRSSPLGAGGFIWSLVDEGVVRRDRGGEIDTWGNHARDGILGVERRWTGDAFAVREILSPVQLAAAEWLGEGASVRLAFENRSDFLALDAYRLLWCVVELPGPLSVPSTRERGCGAGRLPGALPGETGSVELSLPRLPVDLGSQQARAWWEEGALALDLVVERQRPDGVEVVNHWSIAVPSGRDATESEASVHRREEVAASSSGSRLRGGGLEAGLSAANGDLLFVERDGVRLELGPSQLAGRLLERRWAVTRSGWLLLETEAEDDASAAYGGVVLGLDPTAVHRIEWLGGGPGAVWGNRLRGARLGVWRAEASRWPDLPGARGGVRWAKIETERGTLVVVPRLASEADPGAPFVSVSAPAFADDARNARTEFPRGLGLLWRAPEVGTKFRTPNELRPVRDDGSRSRRLRVAVTWLPRLGQEPASATVSPPAPLPSATETM